MKNLLPLEKIAATVCVFGLISPFAAASNWISPSTSGGDYHVDANWSDGIPNAAGAIADIMLDTTGTKTISLKNINTTVGELSLGDINETSIVTLRNAGTTAVSNVILTFDNLDANAQLTVRARAASVSSAGTIFLGSGNSAVNRTALDVHLASNLDIQSVGTGGGLAQFHVRLAAADAGHYTLNLTANSTSTGAVIFQGGHPDGAANAGYITDGAGTISVQQSSAYSDLHLNGDNSYTGGTRVSAGKLFVNNTGPIKTEADVLYSGTGGGDVILEAGTLLGGFGNVGASVITEGDATLQVGYGADAGFTIGDGITLGGDLDIIYGDLVGLLDLGGILDLNGYRITFNLDGYAGDEMELIAFSDLAGGDIDSFDISGLEGFTLEITDTGIGLVAVPEPATYAAITALAMLGYVVARRRKG